MMVDLNTRCGYGGCFEQPSYGVVGITKREFCSQHQMEGMVDLKRKIFLAPSSESPGSPTSGMASTSSESHPARARAARPLSAGNFVPQVSSRSLPARVTRRGALLLLQTRLMHVT